MNPLTHDMPAWMRRLLGIPAGVAHRVEHSHLAFATRWPLWAAVLLLVVALIWFGVLYWHDGSRPTWWVKAPLVLLRLIALSALMVMLAQPTLRLDQVDRVRGNVFVLVDTSDSMAR